MSVGRYATQFTSRISYSSDPSVRIVKRRHVNECPLDNSVSRFSPDIISQVIKNRGTSIAAGTYGLTIHRLKNLDPLGLQYLTHLFNLSLQCS